MAHINDFYFMDNLLLKITDIKSWGGLLDVIFVIECIDFFDKKKKSTCFFDTE